MASKSSSNTIPTSPTLSPTSSLLPMEVSSRLSLEFTTLSCHSRALLYIPISSLLNSTLSHTE